MVYAERLFRTITHFLPALAAVVLIVVPTTWLAAANAQHTELELGVELSHFRYNETIQNSISHEQTFFMRDIGYFAGIAASWGYYGRYMAKLDGVFKMGRVNYTSAGTGCEPGIHDDTLDLRGLIGWNVYHGCHRLTPFIGFGYRYLYDKLFNHGNLIVGHYSGYDREANYFYTPIGVECKRALSATWTIGAMGEYDLFWHGIQVSHFEQFRPDATMLINRQNKGWGARGSLRFARRFSVSNRQLLFEPFVRYWHIARSKKGAALRRIDDQGRRRYVNGVEPNNTTTEFGIKLALRFCGL